MIQKNTKDLLAQIKYDMENEVAPPKKKSSEVEYGMIDFWEGEWNFVSAESGYNFEANNLIEALNFMAQDGWRYISTIPGRSYAHPNKHVLFKNK